MMKLKKKIMGLLLLTYGIAAILILFILNVSYVQNNKNSISRILNMKFQVTSSQGENRQQQEPREQQEDRNSKEESKAVLDQREDSYIKRSYLVAKSREGTFYIKNMLPDTGLSKEQILQTNLVQRRRMQGILISMY